MAVQAQEDSGPDLLLNWDTRPDSRTFFRDGAGSIAVHVIVIALALVLESIPDSPRPLPQFRIDLRQAVHLVDPPIQQMTQREPNTAKVAKEVNVEGLMARPQIKQSIPTPPPKPFHAPVASSPAPPPSVKQPTLMPEQPRIEAEVQPPVNPLPQFGTPQVPPPQSQSPQPPNLQAPTPGQYGTVQRAPGQLGIPPPPKATVDSAISDVVHGQGRGGGTIVGDDDQPPSISDQLHHPQAYSKASVQSSLQLLSDPQGVDFKPYLIRILATVRRNWMAIIPESAHMGRRGKVLLQFIIDRNGGVPKLVIAMPSGAEALDRAAVAGVSASVPFPPLPQEFKGNEVRLQFAFSYNMK